jgi:hypothetical protein
VYTTIKPAGGAGLRVARPLELAVVIRRRALKLAVIVERKPLKLASGDTAHAAHAQQGRRQKWPTACSVT